MNVVLGTAQLTRAYGVTSEGGAAPTRAEAVRLLATAHELGVRTVDTAPGYGDAEEVIGRSGLDLAVHTKVSPGFDPTVSLAASLARLGRDAVDVLHLHDPDAVRADPVAVAAAHALVGRGTAALGASVYTAEQFDAAVADGRIGVIQVPVNLLDRRIDDDRIARATAAGVTVLARSVLLQGLLAGPPDRVLGRVPALDAVLERVGRLAGELDRSAEELALGWVRARPGLTGLVVGVEGPGHLRRLCEVLAGPPLAAEELALLADLPLPSEEAVDPRSWSPPTPR